MRIITKYILREHIGPFFFSLATIVFVFLLNIVFRDLGRLLGKGLPVVIILEFFILNLAWIVALAVPMAVLISTLMAFGRLSADSEISALKASGVHFLRLILPAGVAASILMIGMERFNNVVLPDFNHRYRLLYSDISRKRPTLALEPNIFFDEFENYSLIVREVKEKENRIKGVIIHDYSDAKFHKTIFAREGTVEYARAQERMVLDLFDGEIHEVDRMDLAKYRRLKFVQQRISIPLKNMELKRSNSQHRGDREKSAAMMKEDLRKNNAAVQERLGLIHQKSTALIGEIYPENIWSFPQQEPESGKQRERMPGGFQTRIDGLEKQIEMEKRVLQGYYKANSSLRVEIQKKYSIPVACVVFVMIGAPLGVLARQGGMAVGGGLSLIFFLIYWTFLIGGEQLADRGMLNPVIAMWLPNVLVGIIGIYLVVRTIRESTMVQWERLWIGFKKRNKNT